MQKTRAGLVKKTIRSFSDMHAHELSNTHSSKIQTVDVMRDSVTLIVVAILYLCGVSNAWGQLNIVAPKCGPHAEWLCKTPEEKEKAKAQRLEQERRAAEARRERERKEALVSAETNRLGAHREAEARRLVEMREAAEKARPKPERCEGTKPVVVKGHSSQSISNRMLFQGWKSRSEALAKSKTSNGKDHLAYWCEQLTGNGGYGSIKESCHSNGGRWECSVEATCTKRVSKCPAGAQ